MPANIVVPEMGESIVDARIAKWLKREGEPVAAGEALVELETDKIDVEVSAPEAGVLQQITRPVGEDVKIGEVIGVIADGGQVAEQAEKPGRAEPQTPTAPAGTPSAPAAPAPAAVSGAPDEEKMRATPSARRLADQHDVEIGSLKGTGEAGRVTRKDVDTFIAAASARPAGASATQPPAAVPPAARPVQPGTAPSPRPEASPAAR
ncbi:MAG: biotin/lipoyl-containing protein, partial [Acidobacteriota bacterium]